MITSIINKELKETFREGRFRLLAFITLLLLFTTLLVSYQQYRQEKTAQEAASVEERHVWENQPEKNPHGAAHFGVYLFKPVYPLSFIEPGIQSYTGSILYLEAHKRNSEQFNPAQDQTELARFGNLTPAFVLSYLVPLLIILLGFSGFGREKENGTLKMLAAQGTQKWKLAIGKWIGVFIPVCMLLLPFFAIALFLLSGLNGFSAISFLGFTAVYLLYYAIITNVTLIFSVLFKKTGTAFIASLLFWMVTTILLPRIVGNVAEKKYPIPTQEQIVKEIAEMNKTRGGNIHDLNGDMYKHLVDSLLKKYGVDSVPQLPVNMAGIRLDIGEQMDTKNYDTIYNKVRKQFAGQQQSYNNLGYVSPFLSCRQLALAVAQTDNKAQWHFTDAGEQYRRLFVNKLNRYIAYESKRQEAFTNFNAGREVWKTIPPFAYNRPGFSETMRGTAPQWTAMFLWLIATSALFFFFTRKLKVQ